MVSNLDCLLCLIRRQARKAGQLATQEQSMAYMCDALRIIADVAPGVPAPVIVGSLRSVERKYFGEGDLYAQEKEKYNALLLSMEKGIRERIERTEDKLRTALLFARAGNYIDFGAMHSVDDAALYELLDRVEGEPLDSELYEQFRHDLKNGSRLMYLTDNSGEIVLDKLFVEYIARAYPALDITVMVKGGPVLNDACIKDAVDVGMDKLATVIDSGCAVAGTWLPSISERAREAFDAADIIISKGQANFETLCGCKANVYYLLLCKCERFVELFGMEKLTGIFTNEHRLGGDKL